MRNDEIADGRSTHQKIGLWLGPIAFALMLLSGPPEGLADPAWATAAIGILMAVWWATEAIPIAITALLPLACFPLLGIAGIQDTAAPYSNKVIYLFLGGFIVAFAMQRWNLHRRIALSVLQHTGGNGRSLVGGFMLASAVISMWVMNTSTTMMLLPVAVSVVGVIHKSVLSLDKKARSDFQYALLLGVAYGATIGGMATLVGTAPNALLAGFMLENYGTEIDFASWMMVGVPLAAVMLPMAWIVLTRVVFKVNFTTAGEGQAELKKMKDDMGRISVPEIRVAIIFAIMALTWVGRPFLTQLPGLSALDDSGIAMAGAVALFLLPSGDKRDPLLLRWTYAEQLPWGVLILFGGGLTLAAAVIRTGLAEWIGNAFQTMGMLPLALIVILAATAIIFLTELTSNTATTATFLPIVGAIAIESGFDPIVLTVPITLAASCAFMLPVATPPNAIVFGSGMLQIPKMAKAGMALNIVGIFLVSLAALTLAPRFL
ncbi:MAG: DASS family sodium-coupled anion symporter [Gammaproteobacteria bacterium]|nr:DASS family sodium-coupled anion symporter [Gammaproteobacteria bacterium]MDH3434403.1 DASS family sodium-coupled anion symporter [Gammaproteobacteria bacterium]